MIHTFTTPSHGYRILITAGDDKPTSKDIYSSHLYINNGTVSKNNTPFTDEEIMKVYYGGEISVLNIRMRPVKFNRDKYKKYGKGVREYLEYLDEQFYRMITEDFTPDVIDFHTKEIDYVRGIQFMATSRVHSKKYHDELIKLMETLKNSVAHKKSKAEKASALLDLFSKKVT